MSLYNAFDLKNDLSELGTPDVRGGATTSAVARQLEAIRNVTGIAAMVKADFQKLRDIAASAAELDVLNGAAAITAEISGLSALTKNTWYDDFMGDALDARYSGGAGTDAEALVPAINAQNGGIVRLVGGDVGAGDDAADASVLTLGLNYRADQGGLVFEASLDIDDITTAMFFMGFTDVLATTTVEVPLEYSGASDTVIANAANAAGINYDTDSATDEFGAVGVKATAVTTAQFSGGAPVNNTRVRLRVELSATGGLKAFVNGVQIGAEVANAITITTPITPVIAVMSRTTATRTVDVDYVWVQQNR